MGKKQNKKINNSQNYQSGLYSMIEYPEPDGKSTRHRPRRNNPWGNLKEEDTYQEDSYNSSNYDYSDSDYEDDHDNFYSNNHYD